MSEPRAEDGQLHAEVAAPMLAAVRAASAAFAAADSAGALAAAGLAHAAALLGAEQGDALFLGRATGRGRVVALAGRGIHAGCDGARWDTVLPAAATRACIAPLFEAGTGAAIVPVDAGAALPAGTALRAGTAEGAAGVMLFPGAAPPSPEQCAALEVLAERLALQFEAVRLRAALQRRGARMEAEVGRRTRALRAANAELARAQRRIDEELRVAQALQQAIVSAEFRADPRYDGCARMRAARSVGGDFYDIYHLPDGRLAFVVADTCGKGVQAAIFMTMARSVFQNVVQWTPAPRSCLYGANRMLAQQNPATMFVAACYAVFDPATGRLTYGSGGGDMPMLRRADGRVERLPRVTGLIVGIMEDFAFAEGEAQLEPGDELVLYTDGITEAVAPSGEMFGEDRLAEALSARRPGPAEEIVAQLIGAVEAYSAGREQSDDITCLVLRYLGAG